MKHNSNSISDHKSPFQIRSNGGCQRRIAKACLGTGCVGGRLKTVCLVPEFEITRSGRGAGAYGTVGCDVLGKKVVFKKLKITIVILLENSDFETPYKLQK